MYENHITSVGQHLDRGRQITTLRSLSSVYEVDPVTGGPTSKQRQEKSCIFRVVPS
jgi:hypothetical protein